MRALSDPNDAASGVRIQQRVDVAGAWTFGDDLALSETGSFFRGAAVRGFSNPRDGATSRDVTGCSSEHVTSTVTTRFGCTLIIVKLLCHRQKSFRDSKDIETLHARRTHQLQRKRATTGYTELSVYTHATNVHKISCAEPICLFCMHFNCDFQRTA